MKWKDIFFFNQKDKISIIFLSSLGIISSGLYFAYPYLKSHNTSEDELNKFAQFQESLTPVYFYNESDEDTDTTSSIRPKNKLSPGQQVCLNTVSEEALVRIPGIGKTFSKRIIEYRLKLGGYTNIEQLLEVKGISEKKFRKIEDYLFIDKKHKKYSIKQIIESEHPYLNHNQISSIKNHLSKGGSILTIEDLQSLECFTPRDIDKIKNYIDLKQ